MTIHVRLGAMHWCSVLLGLKDGFMTRTGADLHTSGFVAITLVQSHS